MNISKRKQGILAIICTIAMIVTSITVYNPREVKADPSATVDGKQYSATVKDSGEWTGFACQGIFDSARIHFAWGIAVDAATITASLNGNQLKVAGKNANGMYIPLTEVTNLEVGSYDIVVTATTVATKTAEAKEVSATATLKIEKVEGTTELQKPSAPTGLVANINNLKTDYTIAFANVATATSYKFYLDGTYKKDITNGGIVTIEELGLEAGKTYKFGVSAVNAAGESDITTIDVKVPGKEEETTTGSSTKPLDPSDIKDSEWTLASGSKTVSYYIADGKADKVQVKPQLEGDNYYYIAFLLAAKFKSVTFDGVSKNVEEGAFCRVKVSDLTSGYHTLVVTDYNGTESVTIYFKVAKEEETTTAAYKDGEVLVNESNQTKEVPAYTDGDYWQNEYNNMPVKYVKGKKYVAEVVVSSTAAKKIKMVFQRVNIWDFVDANQGYETSIAAGNKVKITYVFEATHETDNGNFDIYLGSVADKTTLVFESKKLTTYNEVPAGVQTGVEVLEAPGSTKYTVSIDGEERQCKEGEVISVPTEGQGYYDVTKKVAYAPGAKLPVNENMTLKSIKLSVTMTPGASIRLAAPTGLRFQTTVKSGNGIDADEILNSTTVTTGTLITTLDLYTDNGKTLTKDSKYNFLDIANNGWFNDGAKTETGKFCGSIIKIQSKNYGRAYIAVGYAIINYSDGTSQPVYAKVTENNAKSIKYVAEKVKKSEAYNKYKDIIDRYIDGKEISE